MQPSTDISDRPAPDQPKAFRPPWVEEFARLYFTKTIAQFLLHGNIIDFVRSADGGGTGESPEWKYQKLKDYLSFEMFKRRDLVISYDRASGISFRDAAMKKDFLLSVSAYDSLNKTTFAQSLPKDPARAFAILENYFRIRLMDGKKIAFIIDYAETIVPQAQTAFSNNEDRAILVYLLKWAKESLFLNSDMTTVLITDNVNDLNQALTRNPYTAAIEIDYPEAAERLVFIEHTLKKTPKLAELMEMSPEVMAQNTAGLNIVQLKTLLAEIYENKLFFTYDELTRRKKDIIEAEAGGLLGFIETKYTLKNVAGHKYAKRNLLSAAKALKDGRQDVMPMGYLVAGPVGTGKTFLVSCFAADIGVPMVELKNFRSQWQGVTESNLEKVLKILKAMNPVAVMIDEADAYLGNRSASGDSGVSSRVFSMIASFMSNTDHRGKIIWFLLTARPDLMPVDLKRQGRAEEHIALFYPETTDEKKELLEVMLRKTGISNLKPDHFEQSFYDTLKINSGAEMEAALTRAKFRAAVEGAPEVTPEIVKAAFDDFIPPTYPEEVELMNYVAVLECTSRELLPERFKNMPREEVVRKIAEIKASLPRGKF